MAPDADDDEVVLVCPKDARPGQPLFFRDEGRKCKTVVPPNTRPGQRFTVRRSACALGGAAKPKKTPRPRTAQPKLQQAAVPALDVAKAAAEGHGGVAPRSLRRTVSRPEITAADRLVRAASPPPRGDPPPSPA